MAKKYKRYRKDFSFSYATGYYPAIELLKKAPHLVEMVFLSGKGQDGKGYKQVLELLSHHNLPAEENPKLVEVLSDRENTPVVIAFRKENQSIDPENSHIVLDRPDTTGNLGTIIRAGLGFGLRNIAIIRPAVDAWDPRVIRASMGAFFSTRIEYFDSFEAYRQHHQRKFYALALTDNATDLRQTDFEHPCSIVFGNEGAGLPEDIISLCQPVRINHATDIDSLNLATAAAITFYEMGRKSI